MARPSIHLLAHPFPHRGGTQLPSAGPRHTGGGRPPLVPWIMLGSGVRDHGTQPTSLKHLSVTPGNGRKRPLHRHKTIVRQLQWHTTVESAWEGHAAEAQPRPVLEPDTRGCLDARRHGRDGAALAVYRTPRIFMDWLGQEASSVFQSDVLLVAVRSRYLGRAGPHPIPGCCPDQGAAPVGLSVNTYTLSAQHRMGHGCSAAHHSRVASPCHGSTRVSYESTYEEVPH